MVKPDKCVLGVLELDFLGHWVNKHGVRPLEKKVDIIRQISTTHISAAVAPLPGTCQLLSLVRSGLCTNPATTPLSTGQTLPGKSAPLLEPGNGDRLHPSQGRPGRCYPAGSPSSRCPTCLITDASDNAVGAVLQQRIQSVWSSLAYFSRKLSTTETRYRTFDRELLAVYLAIWLFRHFLEGRQFFVVTDHKPLTFAIISSYKHHSPPQIRHLDFIMQFITDIRFLKGSSNAAADDLPRLKMDAIHTGDK